MSEEGHGDLARLFEERGDDWHVGNRAGDDQASRAVPAHDLPQHRHQIDLSEEANQLWFERQERNALAVAGHPDQ